MTEEVKEEKQEKNFEDEVVEDLMSGVKMAVSSRRSDTEGAEVIEAKGLEVREDFIPGVKTAERIESIDKFFSDKIDSVLSQLTGFLEGSREEFKSALKGQIGVIRNEVRNLGDYIGKVFARKLKLRYVERHLKSTYEDVLREKMKEKEKDITREALKEVLPFYQRFQEGLSKIEQQMKEIKKGYTEILSGVIQMSINFSREGESKELQSIERLKGELKKKDETIKELKKKVETASGEIPEAKLEERTEEFKELLSEKQEELSKMRDRVEQLEAKVESLKSEKEEMEKSLKSKKTVDTEELEDLKGSFYDLKGKYKAKQRELGDKEKEIKRLRSIVSEMREGTTELSELKELKKHYKSIIEQKDEQLQELEERLERKGKAEQAISEMEEDLREELKKLKEKALSQQTEKAGEEISGLVSDMKDSFSSLRKSIFEDVVRATDISSDNVALREKIDTLKSELAKFERGNKELRSHLEETKEKLKKLEHQNELLDKRLNEKEEAVEELKKMPEEMEIVLEQTPIGKTWKIIKKLGDVTFDQLANSVGTSAIKVRRYVMKLVQTGLVDIKGRKVVYTGNV